MSKLMRAATFGLLIVASPVLAQTPPPAATTASPEACKMAGKMGGRMFSSLSEAGRATMREAMQASRQGNDRTAVKAARDRMLTLLEADRLDTAALKRAMDEERTLAATSHERRQTAMLDAFTKLSVADRKAFVSEARQLRDKMQDRMQGERGERLKRWRERRGGGAGAQL